MKVEIFAPFFDWLTAFKKIVSSPPKATYENYRYRVKYKRNNLKVSTNGTKNDS